MAEELVALGWVPSQVLSSDAMRTQETWSRMSTVFKVVPDVSFRSGLYHAGVEGVVQEVSSVQGECDVLLVLGHNPGLEAVVHWLCGERVQLTTANCVLLCGEGESWRDALEGGHWELKDVLRPKDL
jgi:phosphohistidine phosphatase